MPALSASVTGVYAAVLRIAWLAGLSALVALLYLIYVVLQGRNATQNMYMYLYGFTLVVCFVLWVMLCVYLARVGAA